MSTTQVCPLPDHIGSAGILSQRTIDGAGDAGVFQMADLGDGVNIAKDRRIVEPFAHIPRAAGRLGRSL